MYGFYYKAISDLYFIRKPRYVFMRKDNLFDLNFSEWFLTRLGVPRLMLVSSIYFSSFPAKESIKARIGCIGLVDTNANSKICNLAIPSNDDSIDWIVLIMTFFQNIFYLKNYEEF